MRRTTAALVLALAFHPAVAAAGPPFQVDDPEPTAYRQFELNLSSQYANQAGTLSGSAPAAGLNYGLMPNVQIALSVQLNEIRTARGRPWKIGYGDTTVGLKVRFVQETARSPQIAFYPAVVIPTGDAKNGLGAGYTKLFLPLWLQKDVGAWTVFGGGGIWRNPGPGNRSYTFSGIAATRPAGRNLSWGAELFHASADTVSGRGSTGFSIGTVRALGPREALQLSVGRSLGTSNALNAYAGYKLQFGGRTTPHAVELPLTAVATPSTNGTR